MKEITGKKKDVIEILRNQLMERLKANFYTLLGASTSFGNPIRFIGKVSLGFKDLFRKPAERSGEGALSIGQGIAEGTESFFCKSIEAAFGT